MSINKKKSKTEDIFDNDFEVIYQEDHYSNLLRDEIAQDNRKSKHYNDHDDNNHSGNHYDGYDDDYDYHNDYDDYDNDDYDDYDDYDDDYDYDDDNYNDDYDDDDYDDDYDDDDYDDDYDYDSDYGPRYHNRRNQDRFRNRRQAPHSSSEKSPGRRGRRLPNLASPAAKSVKTGGRIVYKLVNVLLRGASLILTAAIICTLTVNFWRNHSAYGDIFRALTEKNYVLAAYAAVAGFLLLFELIAFLLILSASKKSDHRGNRYDTGRGLFSFVFIYAGSYLSFFLNGMVPASPAPLLGVQGALLVYGSMRSTLLPLCVAGVISCLIRRFAVR